MITFYNGPITDEMKKWCWDNFRWNRFLTTGSTATFRDGVLFAVGTHETREVVDGKQEGEFFYTTNLGSTFSDLTQEESHAVRRYNSYVHFKPLFDNLGWDVAIGKVRAGNYRVQSLFERVNGKKMSRLIENDEGGMIEWRLTKEEFDGLRSFNVDPTA